MKRKRAGELAVSSSWACLKMLGFQTVVHAFRLISVKQSLWTLREAGTKETWATGGPLIL